MDPSELKVKLNEEFSISLGSVPTTGYVWEAKFDGKMIKIKDKRLKASEPLAIGGGGIETFTFVPIGSGETEITMILKRSWEKDAAEKQTYRIKIS
jgi:inhibitor of cysteine peptidase